MRYNSGAAKAPHLNILDEQIEGIVRFYAASATCQGDKLKWTPTCQGTNCGARMFPGFLLNLSLFLSSAGGQLLVGPLRPLRGHSRLPARVMQPSGLRPSPTDAAAETTRSTVPTGHQRPPKGEARLSFLQTFGGAPTWLPLWGRYVPVGRCPAADRGGSRDAGTAAAVTERATCQRF